MLVDRSHKMALRRGAKEIKERRKGGEIQKLNKMALNGSKENDDVASCKLSWPSG